jgi:hypothetical protein
MIELDLSSIQSRLGLSPRIAALLERIHRLIIN